MKPRARRVTLAAAVLGVGVVAVLVVVNWGTVRDHVEAWRFQLRTATATIEPGATLEVSQMIGEPAWYPDDPKPVFVLTYRALFEQLAAHSGTPVIVDSRESRHSVEAEPFVWQPGHSWSSPSAHNRSGVRDLILQVLRSGSAGVLEQRFPRRAYVVIRSPRPLPGAGGGW